MQTRGSRSDGEDYSETKSPMTGGSPNDRPTSISPSGLNGAIPGLQRQSSDYYMNAMNGGMTVPPHMRNEMANHSPRSASPANAQAYMPVNGGRHPLTSHPTTYPLPNTLEPPTTNGSQNGSVGSSPHISGNGWQSPNHQSLPGAAHPDYSYPDPNTQQYVQNAQNLYYQNTNMHQAPRIGQDMWVNNQQ